MFSCEFREISKDTFFTEHLRTTASSRTKPEMYFGPVKNLLSRILWKLMIVKSHFLFSQKAPSYVFDAILIDL